MGEDLEDVNGLGRFPRAVSGCLLGMHARNPDVIQAQPFSAP